MLSSTTIAILVALFCAGASHKTGAFVERSSEGRPANQTCPDGKKSCLITQTCCLIHNGEKKNETKKYGCCVYSNAACCKDGCCPEGFICYDLKQTCYRGDVHIAMMKANPLSTVDDKVDTKIRVTP